MKRPSIYALAVALALMPALAGPARAQAPAPAAPDVLKNVPESSAMVLVIPKLSSLNEKLGKFFKDFGNTPQEMLSPVASMLDELSIAQGVSMDGSAAVVMPLLQLMGEPRFYAVIPLDDPVAFMANFEAATPSLKAPGVFEVPMGGMPGGAFVKVIDGYAVLGNNEQVVAKHAPAEDAGKLVQDAGPLGRNTIAGSDILLYLNMGKVGPTLQPMVAVALSQAQMQMEQNPDAAASMGGVEMAKITLQTYQDIASALLLQSQAIVVGGKVGDAGITFDAVAQFKPDTTLAKTFSKSAQPTLRFNRLPDKPFLFAMAMDPRAVDWKPVMDAMDQGPMKDLPADSPMAGVMKAYADMIRLTTEYTDMEFAWYSGPAGNPADFFNVAYVYGANEPASLFSRYREAAKKLAAANKQMTQNVEPGTPMMYMDYHENDVEVAGHKADRLTMQMDMPPELLQMNPMAAMFTQPMNTYTTATDTAIVAALSGSPDLLAETIKASDGSGKLGADNDLMALSRQGLPDQRMAEGYLDVGSVIRFIMNMAAGMGAPVQQIEVPAMPPLAVAIASKEGGACLTYHAPTKLIHGVRDYVQMQMNAAMQNMGGPAMVPVQAAEVVLAPAGVNAVTDQAFNDSVVQAPYPVLVNFQAAWNATARKQTPVIEQLAKDFEGDAAFLTLDVDKNPEATRNWKVRAIPTIIVFRNGQAVETFTGLSDKDTLAVAIRKAMAAETDQPRDHPDGPHDAGQEVDHGPMADPFPAGPGGMNW